MGLRAIGIPARDGSQANPRRNDANGAILTQIAVNGIAVEFGGVPVIQDVTFTVGRGERWGIVGRNGSGKTTLLRVVNGELQPTRGSVFRAGGTRISALEQHRDFGGATTVWEAAAGPFAELMALEIS